MSTETHEDRPAYALQADGTLALNGAGIALETRYQKARIGHQALQASWTGAFLARIFMKHAWLDAVTLSFAVSMEYDDSGGFYRYVSCRAEATRAVPQQALPQEQFPDGEFDANAAERIVEDEIEDGKCDLHASLCGTPGGSDGLDVMLERSAVAALLATAPIDGHAAFEAWKLAPAADT